MKLKEKIKLHNQGEYDLIAELMNLATNPKTFKTTMVSTMIAQYGNTYKRWRPEYSQGNTDEERLARNIKIWIARYIKRANSIRDKYTFEGFNSDIAESDALDKIYTTFISFGYHFYKDDFLQVPRSIWKKIEDVHGWEYKDELKAEFDQFCLPLPYINKEKARLQSQYVPLIEEALIEVLPKVDLNMSIDQIIGFLSVSAKRAVDQKLTKLLNTKVHNINGEKYYVTQEKIMENGFVRSEAEDILNVSVYKLTTRQYDFFLELKTLIEKEVKNRNTAPFRFDQEGNPIEINKRYFAQKIGMEESAFKKRLSRMQSK